jgi:excisionase family DNA binding protein
VASLRTPGIESRTVASDDVLTVAEAAVLARVSRQHIYGLIERGELKAQRVGRDGPLRITLSALRAILHEAAAA